MALSQPVVSWFDDTNTFQRTEWDAGIVDAGGESPATIFLVWNNRNPSTTVANTAIADMIDVTITTKSYPAGDNTGVVATKSDAVVYVQFFDSTKPSGGEWGSYKEATGVWTKDWWEDIGGDDTTPVVSCAGGFKTISGAANYRDANVDKANYAKVKLKLAAKGSAGAGQVEWLTRIAYRY